MVCLLSLIDEDHLNSAPVTRHYDVLTCRCRGLKGEVIVHNLIVPHIESNDVHMVCDDTCLSIRDKIAAA
jgi:hypothetical protein